MKIYKKLPVLLGLVVVLGSFTTNAFAVCSTCGDGPPQHIDWAYNYEPSCPVCEAAYNTCDKNCNTYDTPAGVNTCMGCDYDYQYCYNY